MFLKRMPWGEVFTSSSQSFWRTKMNLMHYHPHQDSSQISVQKTCSGQFKGILHSTALHVCHILGGTAKWKITKLVSHLEWYLSSTTYHIQDGIPQTSATNLDINLPEVGYPTGTLQENNQWILFPWQEKWWGSDLDGALALWLQEHRGKRGDTSIETAKHPKESFTKSQGFTLRQVRIACRLSWHRPRKHSSYSPISIICQQSTCRAVQICKGIFKVQ